MGTREKNIRRRKKKEIGIRRRKNKIGIREE